MPLHKNRFETRGHHAALQLFVHAIAVGEAPSEMFQQIVHATRAGSGYPESKKGTGEKIGGANWLPQPKGYEQLEDYISQ
jgi:hypothetical protein